MQDGLERLKKFDSTYQLQDWYYDILIDEKDIPNYESYILSTTHKKFRVDLNKVIGTDHWSYINKNWLECLGNLGRNRFVTKRKFLEYLNANEEYIGWVFKKYGDIFIIDGGHHRTCFARFSGLEYIETEVKEYILKE